MRNYTVIDQLCLKADYFLRFLSGHLTPHENARPSPAAHTAEAELTSLEKNHIAGLMRVNYTGELCAQALYQGQACTTKNKDLKNTLEKAGLEEMDHLYWCQLRLKELGKPVSLLNPLWYSGAFLLGMTAGIAGDSWNLGFLEETEKQVVKHLDKHLENLPINDIKTRAILEQMREEESGHAEAAQTAGARALPFPLRVLMGLTAKIMTTTAYRL